MIGRFLGALWLALALSFATGTSAQPAPAAPATAGSAGTLAPAEAQRVIGVLQDPKQRAQLIETLQAIAKAAPAAGAKPAAASPLAPNSLAAQLLSRIAGWPQELAQDAAQGVQAITDFPLLWSWASEIAENPDERMAVVGALWHAALVMGVALLLEWLARLLLDRTVARLADHAPNGEAPAGESDKAARPWGNGAWQLLRRLPFALARLVLELAPVGVFWGAASLAAGIAHGVLSRLAILIVVNAYATGRVILSIGRALLSPGIVRLRLLLVGDAQAFYLMRWLRRITLVAVFGGAVGDLAVLFGLYQSAYETLMRFVALIVAVLLGILVLRSRQAIAQRLRAPAGAVGGMARWRDWLAGAWHYLAIIALVAGWILWTIGLRNGIGGLRRLILSIAIVVAARLLAILLLGVLDRAARLGGELTGGSPRSARYHAAARAAIVVVVVVAMATALLQVWGADTFSWFAGGRIGARLVSALATVAVAAVAAIAVWEGGNVALERRLARLSTAGSAAYAARLRTLLPILRAALLAAVLSVVGLTALSQIGVDIAPLLAGAGIAGIAVGFGAQKLVQDVITGMFVLIENAIQVGDAITVAGLAGTVERLSVRNLWLRGADGAVHIIPFSAVTSITNANRGLGNAAISVTVAYEEDVERVTGALRDIAAEMRRDDAFAPLMLGDLQIWVDTVKAWGVTFSGQIACTDAGRWPVQREFNRRLQRRFRELGIELSDWYAAPSRKPA